MNQITGMRLAYSVKDAAEVSGIGRTAIFAAIKSGQIVARKFGKRTLISAEDLKAFVESLPTIKKAPINSRVAE
ncbi:MAG TPA: helix-turn-helix domain-containing protein [Pseudolabrys sp.]|nr:helix-turn-helix domain-containing protein [Pseudolabrys sp.]